MPKILYFPYFGPNRRDDRRLVEVRIDFAGDSGDLAMLNATELREVLLAGSVIPPDMTFPDGELPAEKQARFAFMLGELAALFQNRAGHTVSVIACRPRHAGAAWLVLVEYQHCDVGMTAVKLAVEVLQGQRRQLKEVFERFRAFADERRLPAETRAIMAAAMERDIPCLQLEQPPFSGAAAGGFRVRPNGLLMVGHGARAEILDGSFCLSRADEEARALLTSFERRQALLRSLGIPVADSGSAARVLIRVGARVFGAGDVDGPSGAEIDVLDRLAAATGALAIGVQCVRTGSDTGAVIDFTLGPDLGVLANSGEVHALEAAAGSLLDTLCTDPGRTRIPLIAITGTNGKTTTSRMVDHILRQAGYQSGLVCTDGVFRNGKKFTDKDESTIQGHGRVLTHRGVEAAVLETHHRGIAVRGFAFLQSDVGVCLNVTEEHIKSGEIESLEEMARIKQAVPERGRHAVLFADDACCRDMIGHLQPERLWLVSLEQDVHALRRLAVSHAFGGCVLENMEDSEWLVLYEGDRRLPVMPVADIPATLGGTARFNLSNAMHAAVAAGAVGVSVENIRGALTGFEASPEMTPGRLNVFDQLPFRVVVDFAHTPDGVAKIADFADRQPVKGRRILAFSGSQGRDPSVWEGIGRAAAGHFDLYFCKEYPPRPGFQETNSAPALKRGLLEGGVPEVQVRLAKHGEETAFAIFDACAPGDLLVFLVGHLEMARMPGYIEAYRKKASPP